MGTGITIIVESGLYERCKSFFGAFFLQIIHAEQQPRSGIVEFAAECLSEELF